MLRRRPMYRTLPLIIALLLAASFAAIPGVASARDPVADRYEQYDYARKTLNLTYEQYVARQADFRAAGCTNGWNDPGGTTKNCTKTEPLNQFDWTDDGCSGAEVAGYFGRAGSNVYRNLFNQPCRLHDFGYRNFGKGLKLYRHEDMRKIIDDRFAEEMLRLCDKKFSGVRKFANWVACGNEAGAVYNYLRFFGEKWGTAETAPQPPVGPLFSVNPVGPKPSGTVLTLTPSTPCPPGSVWATAYWGGDSRGGAYVDTGGWWVIRTQTVSSTDSVDPVTGLLVGDPRDLDIVVRCHNDSDVLMDYAEAAYHLSRGLPFALSLNTTDPATDVLTIQPVQACPVSADSVRIYTAAKPTGTSTSTYQEVSIAVSSDGRWDSKYFSYPSDPAGTEYSVGVQCWLGSKVSFYYQSAKITRNP